MFEFLKNDTGLSSGSTDIKGMTEEEVYAVEDQYTELAKQEPEEGSIIKEGIGHLRFNTAIGSVGEHLYNLYNAEPDPDFNIEDALTLKELPLETFEPYEQQLLSYASSSAHMEQILEQIEDKREWKRNAKALGGVTSFAVDAGAELLNPINWVSWRAAGKYLNGAKRFAIAALGNAVLSGAEEAAIRSIYKDKTLSDVVYGTVLGGAIGGTLGYFVKPSALNKAQETVAKNIKESTEKLIQESVQEKVLIVRNKKPIKTEPIRTKPKLADIDDSFITEALEKRKRERAERLAKQEEIAAKNKKPSKSSVIKTIRKKIKQAKAVKDTDTLKVLRKDLKDIRDDIISPEDYRAVTISKPAKIEEPPVDLIDELLEAERKENLPRVIEIRSKLLQEKLNSIFPEGSVGAMKLDPYQELTGKVHAQFKGAPDDPTVMQAFNKLIEDKLPKQTGRLRPDEIVGIGESFQRSDNPLERYLGSLIVEHSEGTGGKITAEHSADLLADVYFQANRARYIPAYIKNSKLFKSEKAKKKLNIGSFDDAVYKEVDALDLGKESLTKLDRKLEPWEQAVVNQADAIRKTNKKLYEFCKEKGVTEFQGKDVNDLYLMRPYDAKKFVRMANLHGKEKVINLIHKAINTGEEFPQRLAKALKRNLKAEADALPEEEVEKEVKRITRRMAEAVFNRMSNRTIHTGADANVLKTANQKLLLDAMQDIGISKTDIDHVKYVLDTAGRDRFSDPNKGRISMNMSVTEGDLSMTDLLSTDLAGGFLGEIRRWSARAALAEKGFPDRGVYDNALLSMTEVGKSIDDSSKGLKRTQKAYDRLSAAWDLIQGKPIEKDVDASSKKLMRGLRKMAAAAKLGKIVVAQASETGRAAAAVGALRMLRELPSLRKMVRNAKTGLMDDALLMDLERAGHGRIGDELFLRHPDFRIEETYEGAFKGEHTLDRINYGLAKYTGFDAVQKIQKRLFARTYAMKLFDEITSGKLNKALANDLGIDDRMQKLFKTEMEKYAETVPGFGKRKVANLNVRKWNSEARETFIAVLHKKSSNAIQKIYVGDLPLWSSKSFGQFMLQFRSFGLASAGKHGVHDYRMLKSGNTEGINAFLFTSALATALYIGKTEVDSFGLSPRKRKKYLKNRLSEKAIAKNVANWMGQLGITTDATQMLMTGFAPQLLGEDMPYARTGDVGSVFTAIPGIGYTAGAVKGVTGAFRAATSDYEFSNSDFNAAWGSIPFNNVFGITNLRNLTKEKYFK